MFFKKLLGVSLLLLLFPTILLSSITFTSGADSGKILVFQDSFEGRIASFWNQIHGTVKLSTNIAHSGSYSYIIDSEQGGLVYNFVSDIYPSKNETWEIEGWFYDNLTTPISVFGLATGNSAGVLPVAITSNAYSCVGQNGGQRQIGWHRVNIIHSPSNAVIYLDGIQRYQTSSETPLNRFFFGDWWIDNCISYTYFDDFKVWKYSSVEPTPSPLPTPSSTPNLSPTPTAKPTISPTPTPTQAPTPTATPKPTTNPFTTPTPSPTTIPNEVYTRTYQWTYKSHDFTWTMDIPSAMYQEYKNIPSSTRRLNDILSGFGYVTTTKDPFIKMVATSLNDSAAQQGFNAYDTVSYMLAFVQSLEYTSDSVTTGVDEYHRFPMETLVDNGGDCEDTAALFGTLVLDLNYGIAYINFPSHLAVGVQGKDLSGYYFDFNDKKYYYSETTGNGWSIGELPDDYIGVKARIYIPTLSYQYIATCIPSPLPIVTLPVKITITPTPNPTSTLAPIPTPKLSTPEPTQAKPSIKPTMQPLPTSIKDTVPNPTVPEVSFTVVILLLMVISILAVKLGTKTKSLPTNNEIACAHICVRGKANAYGDYPRARQREAKGR